MADNRENDLGNIKKELEQLGLSLKAVEEVISRLKASQDANAPYDLDAVMKSIVEQDAQSKKEAMERKSKEPILLQKAKAAVEEKKKEDNQTVKYPFETSEAPTKKTSADVSGMGFYKSGYDSLENAVKTIADEVDKTYQAFDLTHHLFTEEDAKKYQRLQDELAKEMNAAPVRLTTVLENPDDENANIVDIDPAVVSRIHFIRQKMDEFVQRIVDRERQESVAVPLAQKEEYIAKQEDRADYWAYQKDLPPSKRRNQRPSTDLDKYVADLEEKVNALAESTFSSNPDESPAPSMLFHTQKPPAPKGKGRRSQIDLSNPREVLSLVTKQEKSPTVKKLQSFYDLSQQAISQRGVLESKELERVAAEKAGDTETADRLEKEYEELAAEYLSLLEELKKQRKVNRTDTVAKTLYNAYLAGKIGTDEMLQIVDAMLGKSGTKRHVARLENEFGSKELRVFVGLGALRAKFTLPEGLGPKITRPSDVTSAAGIEESLTDDGKIGGKTFTSGSTDIERDDRVDWEAEDTEADETLPVNGISITSAENETEVEAEIRQKNELAALYQVRDLVSQARKDILDPTKLVTMSRGQYLEKLALSKIGPTEEEIAANPSDSGIWEKAAARLLALENMSSSTNGAERDRAFDLWGAKGYRGKLRSVFRTDSELAGSLETFFGLLEKAGINAFGSQDEGTRVLGLWLHHNTSRDSDDPHRTAVLEALKRGEKVAASVAAGYSFANDEEFKDLIVKEPIPELQERKQVDLSYYDAIREYLDASDTNFLNLKDVEQYDPSGELAFYHSNQLLGGGDDSDEDPANEELFRKKLESIIAKVDRKKHLLQLFAQLRSKRSKEAAKKTTGVQPPTTVVGSPTIITDAEPTTVDDKRPFIPEKGTKRVAGDYFAQLYEQLTHVANDEPTSSQESINLGLPTDKSELFNALSETKNVLGEYINSVKMEQEELQKQIDAEVEAGNNDAVLPLRNKMNLLWTQRRAAEGYFYTSYPKYGELFDVPSSDILIDKYGYDMETVRKEQPKKYDSFAPDLLQRIGYGLSYHEGNLNTFRKNRDSKSFSFLTIESQTGLQQLLDNKDLLQKRLEFVRQRARETLVDPGEEAEVLKDITNLENMLNRLDEIETSDNVTPKDQVERKRIANKAQEIAKRLSKKMRWDTISWGERQHPGEENPLPQISANFAYANALPEADALKTEAVITKGTEGILSRGAESLELFLDEVEGAASSKRGVTPSRAKKFSKHGESATFLFGGQGKGYVNNLQVPDELKSLVTDDNRTALAEGEVIIQQMLEKLSMLENSDIPVDDRSNIQQELLALAAKLRNNNGGESVLALLKRLSEKLDIYARWKERKANKTLQHSAEVAPIEGSEQLVSVVTGALSKKLTVPTSVGLTEWQDSEQYDRMKAGVPLADVPNRVKVLSEVPNVADSAVLSNPMENLLNINMAIASDAVANPSKYDDVMNPDFSAFTRSSTMNFRESIIPGTVSGNADPALIYDKLNELRQKSEAYANIVGLGKTFSSKTTLATLLEKVPEIKRQAFLEAARKISESGLALAKLGIPGSTDELSELFDVRAAIRRVDNPDEMAKIKAVLLDALTAETPSVQVPAEPLPVTGNAVGSMTVTDIVSTIGGANFDDFRKKDLAIDDSSPEAQEQREGWLKRQIAPIIGQLGHARGEQLLGGQKEDRDAIVANALRSSWERLAKKNTHIKADNIPQFSEKQIENIYRTADKLLAANPFENLETVEGGARLELPLTGDIEDLNVRARADYVDKNKIVDYKFSTMNQPWTDSDGNVISSLIESENESEASSALKRALAQMSVYSRLLGGQRQGEIRHIYKDKNGAAHLEVVKLTDDLVRMADVLANAALHEAGVLHPETTAGHLVGPNGPTQAQIPVSNEPTQIEIPVPPEPPIIPPIPPTEQASAAPEEPDENKPAAANTYHTPYSRSSYRPTVPPGDKTIPQFGNEFHDNKFYNNTFFGSNGGAVDRGGDISGIVTNDLVAALKDVRSVLTNLSQGQRGSPEGFRALRNEVMNWNPKNPDLAELKTSEETLRGNDKVRGLFNTDLLKDIGNEDLRPEGEVVKSLVFARNQIAQINKSANSSDFRTLQRILHSKFSKEGNDEITNRYLETVQQYVAQYLKESFAANPGLEWIDTEAQKQIQGITSNALEQLGGLNGALTGAYEKPELDYKELTREQAAEMLQQSYERNASNVRTSPRFNNNYLRSLATVRELTYSARGVAQGILGYDSPASEYVGNISNIIQSSLSASSGLSNIMRGIPQLLLERDSEYLGALGLKDEARTIQEVKIDPLQKQRQMEKEKYDALVEEVQRKLKAKGKGDLTYTDENGVTRISSDYELTRLQNKRQEVDSEYGLKIRPLQQEKEMKLAAAQIGIEAAQNRISGMTDFYQKFGNIISGVTTVTMLAVQGMQLYNKWARSENETTLESQKLAKEFSALRIGVNGVTQSITSLDQLISAATKLDKDFAATTKDYMALQTYQRAMNEIMTGGTQRREKTVLFEGDAGTKLAKDTAKEWEAYVGNSLSKMTTDRNMGTVGQNYLSIARNIGSFVNLNEEERYGRFIIAPSKEPTLKEGLVATDAEKAMLLGIANVVKRTNANGTNLTETIRNDPTVQLLIANELGKQQLEAMKSIAGSTESMAKNAQSSAFVNLLFAAQQNSQKNVFTSPQQIDTYAKNNPDMLVSQIALGNLGSAGDIIMNSVSQESLANWSAASTKFPNLKGMDASAVNNLMNDMSNPGMASALRAMNKGEDYTDYLFGNIYDYLEKNNLLGDAEKDKAKYIEKAKEELRRQLKDSIPTAGMFSYQQWQVYDKLAVNNPDEEMTSPGGRPFTYSTYTAEMKRQAKIGLEKDLENYKNELAKTDKSTPDFYKLVTQINQTRQALADLADSSNNLKSTWFNIAGAVVKPTQSMILNNFYPNLQVYINGEAVSASDVKIVTAAPDPITGNVSAGAGFGVGGGASIRHSNAN